MTRPEDTFDDDAAERELDRYLAGESELTRAYREGADELPPVHVDSAIRRAARLAAEERARPPWWARLFGPPRPSSPFGQQWAVPAVAASVVIVATLAVLVSGDPSSEVALDAPVQPLLQPVDADNRPIAEQSETRDEAAGEPASVRIVPEAPAPAATGTVLFDSTREQAGAAEESGRPVAAAAVAPTAPAETSTEFAPPPPSPAPVAADSVIPRAAVKIAPQRSAGESTAATSPDSTQLRKAREALAATQRNIAEFERRRSAVREERQMVGKALAESPTATGGAGSTATEGGTAAPSAAAGFVDRPAAAVPADAGAATPAVSAPATRSATQGDTPAQGPALLPRALRESVEAAGRRDRAEAPLDRVRELVADGRIAEAREALRRLLAEDPDLVVPDDLRSALSLP